MPLPNWGNLEKSQTDSETIEGAIARLIQDHLDDPDAHIEDGQSLYVHKISDIIDHLIASVVRDKIKFDRFQIDQYLDTLDGWSKSAGAYLDSISQLSLTTTGANGNNQYAYLIPGDSLEDQGNETSSPIWEVRVKIAQSTNQTCYIGQMDPTAPAGYGFKIVNGTLYKVYWDDDSDEQTEEITGITVTQFHTYRCEYVYDVSVKWYVDGVLKKTMTTDLPTLFSMFVYFSIKADAAAVKLMYIQSVHFDADYSQ